MKSTEGPALHASTAIEAHPLQPFIPERACLLMLGSFPPPRKRWSMDFFYPNFLNDMWRIYGLIYRGDKNAFVDLEHKRFRREELIDFLTDLGVALYDTAENVRRQNGNASDKYLEIVRQTDVRHLLSRMPDCRAIAATGQKSVETLGENLQLPSLPAIGQWVPYRFQDREIRCYRMPSTSRAYPLALEKKTAIYAAMLRDLKIL